MKIIVNCLREASSDKHDVTNESVVFMVVVFTSFMTDLMKKLSFKSTNIICVICESIDSFNLFRQDQ